MVKKVRVTASRELSAPLRGWADHFRLLFCGLTVPVQGEILSCQGGVSWASPLPPAAGPDQPCVQLCWEHLVVTEPPVLLGDRASH